jgi:hypothetical protein
MGCDRRYDNLKDLQGATFLFAKYKAPRDDWKHDHCVGCWATFSEFDGPDILHQGYVHAKRSEPQPEPEFVTRSNQRGMRFIPEPLVNGCRLRWLCSTCFNDFHQTLGFSLELGESRGAEILGASKHSVCTAEVRVKGRSSGTGQRFDEINHKTTRLEEHGFSLIAIKEWREREAAAGRPSSLNEFYRIHGICSTCRCYGLQMTGWDAESEVPLWTVCSASGGTGRVPVS